MYTVRHLLESKNTRIWAISPHATVYEALELMAAHNIGAVLVMENETLVGIFTERDYARKVVLHGKTSKTATVGELMTTEVTCIRPEDTIEDCMSLMTDKRTRHLPVMEHGKLIGVVSIGDVVKAIISDRELMIRELERYITGGHSSLP
jgi:CBS domain-containing protein